MWLLEEIEGEKRKKVFSNKEKNSILNYWHSSSIRSRNPLTFLVRILRSRPVSSGSMCMNFEVQRILWSVNRMEYEIIAVCSTFD